MEESQGIGAAVQKRTEGVRIGANRINHYGIILGRFKP